MCNTKGDYVKAKAASIHRFKDRRSGAEKVKSPNEIYLLPTVSSLTGMHAYSEKVVFQVSYPNTITRGTHMKNQFSWENVTSYIKKMSAIAICRCAAVLLKKVRLQEDKPCYFILLFPIPLFSGFNQTEYTAVSIA